MNHISLILTPSGWTARFSGPHAAGIVSDFGTADLPTPFTTAADPDAVLAEISRRNPGAHVTFECAICSRPGAVILHGNMTPEAPVHPECLDAMEADYAG